MVDATAFEVGKNLATTPGKVVYRNELIELIQYEPRTERVHEVPILFLPPWINKYYILDLSEKNSFVKYLVEQGFTVFMTSWKNPDASMEGTTFEDYMTLGPLKAVDVVREITGSDKVNPVGYCIGGVLLAMTLAWLAAGDDEEAKQQFGDPTFMVSLQDYSEVGDTEVFMDEPQFEAMEMQMMERGYLDDRKMANMFNLLRSSDLIWANVINNYLLGPEAARLRLALLEQRRHAHGPRRPQLLHQEHLPREQPHEAGQGAAHGPPDRPRAHHERRLRRGRREGPHRALEVGLEDQQARGHRITHFTLAASGHIAGMISPPAKARGYWTAEDGRYETAEEWRTARRRARGHLVGGLDKVARPALRGRRPIRRGWAATSTRP